jgi:hypothetical protein
MTDMTFLETMFSLHLGSLIIGLLLVKLFKTSLRKVLPIYFLMVSINALSHYLVDQVFPWFQLSQGIVALSIVIVLTGLLGKRLNSMDYGAILVFMGLSPWYLGWHFQAIFVMTTLIMLAGWGMIRQMIVLHSMGERPTLNIAQIPNRLKERYNEFQNRSRVSFPIPILCSALITGLFMILP